MVSHVHTTPASKGVQATERPRLSARYPLGDHQRKIRWHHVQLPGPYDQVNYTGLPLKDKLGNRDSAGGCVSVRLMDKILHESKYPKLWELWYIPYNG